MTADRKRARRVYERMSAQEIDDLKALSPESPRVEECIAAVMKRFPSTSPSSVARYFEAVHQELGPLARELEAEIADLKEQNAELKRQLQRGWREISTALRKQSDE